MNLRIKVKILFSINQKNLILTNLEKQINFRAIIKISNMEADKDFIIKIFNMKINISKN